MDPPHPPSPPIPPPQTTTPSPPKLRLMVSYNGHIVPRPNDKSLFYAGGETRIISFHRATVSSSLSSFTSHLSLNLSKNNNLPFNLKYQLPNEDLDSLISVSTDEDLVNMLEEHDRVSKDGFGRCERIRLFLFPVKAECVGTERWFCDALKNTGGGKGVDNTGLINNGVPESMVLETNSSFGSTNSSVSMSNLPPVGVKCEDGGVGLVDKKARVPSTASIESDTSNGSSGVLPKPVALQESVRQVVSGEPTFTIGPEITLVDPSTMVQLPKTVQLSGYQLPQQSDGKQQQHEVQYVQGSASYIPQYSAAPLHPTSYYPVYQMPMPQQQNGSYPVNQPYPVYYYPVRPVPSYSMPIHNNVINSQNLASSLAPLHPQTATVFPPVVHKEILTAQSSPDSPGEFQGTVRAAPSLVSVPSGRQLMPPSEHVQPSQTIPAAIMDITSNSNELDNNIAYTQIYKTQPSMPVLPAHYPAHTMGASVLMSDSSMQPMNVKHLASSLPQ